MAKLDKESHDIIVSDIGPPSTQETHIPGEVEPQLPSNPVDQSLSTLLADASVYGQTQVPAKWLCACGGGCWSLYSGTK